MTLSYLLKLVCLGLASFFLVHLALALVVRLATPLALGLAARIRPARAARLLFFARMFPAGCGVLIVAGLCVPSYFWLEPKTATSEGIGWLCLGLSMLTVFLCSVSIRRGLLCDRALDPVPAALPLQRPADEACREKPCRFGWSRSRLPCSQWQESPVQVCLSRARR